MVYRHFVAAFCYTLQILQHSILCVAADDRNGSFNSSSRGSVEADNNEHNEGKWNFDDEPLSEAELDSFVETLMKAREEKKGLNKKNRNSPEVQPMRGSNSGGRMSEEDILDDRKNPDARIIKDLLAVPWMFRSNGSVVNKPRGGQEKVPFESESYKISRKIEEERLLGDLDLDGAEEWADNLPPLEDHDRKKFVNNVQVPFFSGMAAGNAEWDGDNQRWMEQLAQSRETVEEKAARRKRRKQVLLHRAKAAQAQLLKRKKSDFLESKGDSLLPKGANVPVLRGVGDASSSSGSALTGVGALQQLLSSFLTAQHEALVLVLRRPISGSKTSPPSVGNPVTDFLQGGEAEGMGMGIGGSAPGSFLDSLLGSLGVPRSQTEVTPSKQQKGIDLKTHNPYGPKYKMPDFVIVRPNATNRHRGSRKFSDENEPNSNVITKQELADLQISGIPEDMTVHEFLKNQGILTEDGTETTPEFKSFMRKTGFDGLDIEFNRDGSAIFKEPDGTEIRLDDEFQGLKDLLKSDDDGNQTNKKQEAADGTRPDSSDDSLDGHQAFLQCSSAWGKRRTRRKRRKQQGPFSLYLDTSGGDKSSDIDAVKCSPPGSSARSTIETHLRFDDRSSFDMKSRPILTSLILLPVLAFVTLMFFRSPTKVKKK